jgi:hypothetical protein
MIKDIPALVDVLFGPQADQRSGDHS